MLDIAEFELNYIILRDIDGTPEKSPTSFLPDYRDKKKAAIFIERFIADGYVKTTNGELFVTEKGKQLKEELLKNRSNHRKNVFINTFHNVKKSPIELKSLHKLVLSETKYRDCAMLMIAEDILGIRADVGWKKELVPDYKEQEKYVRDNFNRAYIIEQLEQCKSMNYEKYRISALMRDDTCDKCRNMDNQVFLVKNAVIGENCPPFHEGCRCTIFAEIPSLKEFSEEEDKELEKLLNDEDFLNSLSEKERKKLIEFRELSNCLENAIKITFTP